MAYTFDKDFNNKKYVDNNVNTSKIEFKGQGQYQGQM